MNVAAVDPAIIPAVFGEWAAQRQGISRTTPTFNTWPESWGGNNEVFNADWVRRNVQTGHGALGAQYPDAVYLFEGDTPSFLYLIPNGLHCPEHVNYGGWGGRFEPDRKLNVRSGTGNDTMDPSLDRFRDYALYSDAKDAWTFGATDYENEYCTVFRWREAFQADFAARMDWCIKSFRDANHHPIAVVNGSRSLESIELEVAPAAELTLDGSARLDPDKDTLSYARSVYKECGTYPGVISLKNDTSAVSKIDVPLDAAGKTFHVILTLTDNGTPELTAYRRVIVTVKRH